MYDVTLSLRLKEEIYEKIKNIAEEEKRSINGEINYILEKCSAFEEKLKRGTNND